MASVVQKPRFRTIQHIQPDYSTSKITQYESERTGMRIVVVDQQGPKLYGYFVVATEIHDDSGAPHTLEHLCFMGSKSYPYTGFADKLAARAYSSLNAWTATDHTAYSIETAGWAGMAQIIPVYLDHIILPKLTDSAFVTEVHHIDGEGNDAGVVYAEMQAIQNAADEIMDLRSKQLLYPEGVGFRYETSGMLEPLRVLTAKRIREFHRELYQPRNMCVCLFGEVDHDDLLAILDKFEDSILPDIPSPEKPFSRPWVESKQAPAITETVIERIEFPEEDESLGLINIYFLGPDCIDNLQYGALAIALLYLCGSSAAVLDKALVETERLAGSITFQTESRPRSVITFNMAEVEKDRLEAVEQRFFAILKKTIEEPLDMHFMQDCIDRQVRDLKFKSETSGTSFFDHVNTDYLFGKRDGSTLPDLCTLKHFTHDLSSWTETQWKDFICKYISEAHHVSLLGVPSAKLSEKLKADEASRLEAQKKELGPDGLEKMAEHLKAAKKENDTEVPPTLMSDFKIPPVDSIHFIHTTGARAGPAIEYGRPENEYQAIIEANGGGSDYPLSIAFEHVPSDFARIHLLIGTETLPLRLRPYLSIYLEAFFSLPVHSSNDGDSDAIPWDKAVLALERDTVEYSFEPGHGLGVLEGLKVTFKVAIENYALAIKYIRKHLFGLIFDTERLENITSRLLADTVNSKREGSNMLAAVHTQVHHAPESIQRARSTLVRALFLKRIKQLLKTRPEEVKKDLETVRDGLFQFPNLRLFIVTDLKRVKEPVQAWKELLGQPSLDTSLAPGPLGNRRERLSEAGLHPGKHSYVVPMPTVDGGFLWSFAKGITSYDAPELPALMVALTYLNATEGPLWTAVRGPGLAYNCQLNYDVDGGFIYLDIYRSPNSCVALTAAKQIVGQLASGELPLQDSGLEGAISTIVMGMADESATLVTAAGTKFVKEVMWGLSADYNEVMLKKVRNVSKDEIRAVLGGMISGVFRPKESDVLVTCGKSLAEAIKTGLESIGYNTEIRTLASFQDDYGWKAGEDEPEFSDDEEDEDEDMADEIGGEDNDEDISDGRS